MKKDGSVSLWVGYALSEELAFNLIFNSYDNDGEIKPSWFSSQFLTERFDPDFVEIVCSGDVSTTLQQLFDGISYEEQLIYKIKPKLLNLQNVNLVLLIYNFEFQGVINSAKQDNIFLQFIDVFEYNSNI